MSEEDIVYFEFIQSGISIPVVAAVCNQVEYSAEYTCCMTVQDDDTPAKPDWMSEQEYQHALFMRNQVIPDYLRSSDKSDDELLAELESEMDTESEYDDDSESDLSDDDESVAVEVVAVE